MQFPEFFQTALSLSHPWRVRKVDFFEDKRLFEVHVKHSSRAVMKCPHCGERSAGYDTRQRRWRHLDACGYQTWILCDVPRVDCAEHGVVQLEVPWADVRSRFTAPFECVVIDWLQEASVQAVARIMKLSWKAAYGIQERAVKRGLDRRGPIVVSRIGVDETSFQKRHEYVTIVNDLDGKRVLHVEDDRKQSSLEGFFKGLDLEALEGIEVVAMDMHGPYITATAMHVPQAEDKIAYDRFHVAKHLSDAVDKVRRQEHRELSSEGSDVLKGTKYHWLKNPSNMKREMKQRFRDLKDTALKVARAWAIKEAASKLWCYKSRIWAAKAWLKLCDWASRTRLAPVVKAAKTIRRHLLGILNAIVHNVTNASAEGINSKVQKLKGRANGYRNRARFRQAIYFHLGGLDLYPRPSATHTNG